MHLRHYAVLLCYLLLKLQIYLLSMAAANNSPAQETATGCDSLHVAWAHERGSCHCEMCMQCLKPCCNNPAVRSGKCCDPTTLGFCLQPYEPQCFAPCCHLSVQLRDDYRWVDKQITKYVPIKLINPLTELYPIDEELQLPTEESNVESTSLETGEEQDEGLNRRSRSLIKVQPRRPALSQKLRMQGRQIRGSKKLTAMKVLPHFRRQLISSTEMINNLGKGNGPKKIDICFSINA